VVIAPGAGTPFCRWCDSLRRSGVLAAVLAFHVALLGLLLVPPGPKPHRAIRRPDRPRDAIAVRLIPARQRPFVDAATRPRRLQRALQGLRRSRRPAAPVPDAAAAPPGHLSRAVPVLPPVLAGHGTSLVSHRETPAYIPGGRSFAERLRGSKAGPAPRVPGSAVALAPGVHMIDPRSQGLAGAARFIGWLGGASDPACVELDALGRLTDEERRAQHVSLRDMKHLVATHHCMPRSPELPHPDRP
jgi:hypothetical protein